MSFTRTNEDIFSLKGFTEVIGANIKRFLPEEYKDAEIKISEIVKDNDTMQYGITVRLPDERVVPTLYMDKLYQRYVDGEEIFDLIAEAAQMRLQAGISKGEQNNYLPDAIMDYKKAVDHLVVGLCNTAWNKKRLEGKLGRTVGEFTETYRISIDLPDGENGSVMVTDDMPGIWGISKEQLHADAIAANDKRIPTLNTMEDALMNLSEGKPVKNLFDSLENGEAVNSLFPLFCLSTADKVFGASLMLRDDILQKSAEVLKDNFYILPSSVHEVLLVPEKSGPDPEDLARMVCEVNANEVMPQDRLSDHVHFYDREAHTLTNMYDGTLLDRDQLDNLEPNHFYPGGMATQSVAIVSENMQREYKPRKKHSR